MCEDLLTRRDCTPMDHVLTKEESYVQRRQLFKNIWETAMHIDEKEMDVMKPKVIKTLRMDEIDKCPVGKPKKQKIKNLRHVCNRILDFCNKQEADDKFHEQQLAPEGNIPTPIKTAVKLRKHKLKKVKKPKCMFTEANVTVARIAIPDRIDPSANVKIEGTTLKRKVKPKKSKSIKIKVNEITGELLSHRKIIKKKRFKRKPSAVVSPIP